MVVKFSSVRGNIVKTRTPPGRVKTSRVPASRVDKSVEQEDWEPIIGKGTQKRVGLERVANNINKHAQASDSNILGSGIQLSLGKLSFDF